MEILGWKQINECKDISYLLVSHVAEIYGTKYSLPKRLFAKSYGDFILTGRQRGIDNGGISEAKFIQGNPIDILAFYIKRGDFYSTNSDRIILNELHHNRRIFPINSLRNNKNIRFERVIKFYPKNGVLESERVSIHPESIHSLKEISSLRKREGFAEAMRKYLKATEKEADSLINYLF